MTAAVEIEGLPTVIHAAYSARTHRLVGMGLASPSTSDRLADYGAKVMLVRASAATPVVKKD